jgi:hypothetical protein
MSAIDFLENKIQLKVTIPTPKQKPITENITLNYQLITFITQDILPTIEVLHEKGVFTKNKIYNHLQKLSDGDSDYMFGVYQKNNRKEQYMKDYESVIGYFKSLSSKLLSDYQKTNDWALEELLFIITGYEFILISAPFVAIEFGNKPNYKIIDKIREELETIKVIFDKRFSALSNVKFTHGQYQKLFEKIKYCSHKQFLGLIDGTLK